MPKKKKEEKLLSATELEDQLSEKFVIAMKMARTHHVTSFGLPFSDDFTSLRRALHGRNQQLSEVYNEIVAVLPNFSATARKRIYTKVHRQLLHDREMSATRMSGLDWNYITTADEQIFELVTIDG